MNVCIFKKKTHTIPDILFINFFFKTTHNLHDSLLGLFLISESSCLNDGCDYFSHMQPVVGCM